MNNRARWVTQVVWFKLRRLISCITIAAIVTPETTNKFSADEENLPVPQSKLFPPLLCARTSSATCTSTRIASRTCSHHQSRRNTTLSQPGTNSPPITHDLPLPRMRQRDNILPQQQRDNLAHFQQADVLPQTRPPAGPEREKTSLHLLQLLRSALDLSLGNEFLGIRKDVRITLHDPPVAADDRARRDEPIADVDAAGWDVALEEESDAGVYARCFFDDGLRVGEMRLWIPCS